MSNSTTNLDLVSQSQAGKEITINAALDAASPAMLYGRRATTTAGLTWGYYGGTVLVSGAPTTLANGTVTLTPLVINYVQANPATGAVSVNTTGFTAGHKQLYSIAAGASSVIGYTDLRTLGGDAGGVSSVNGQDGDVTLDAADVGADASGTAADTMMEHLTDTNPHPEYLTQAEGDARYLQSIGAQPFDIHTFYPGVPGASAKLYRGKLARAVTFSANFAGAQFTATVNATGSTVFDIQKNGASVGSCTIAAGSMTPTFASSGGATVSFAAGDIFAVYAPATADATLADPAITFAGVR